MNQAPLCDQIEDLIGRMTLEEKASLCSGADFWNLQGIEHLDIPSVMVTDGPHGLRKQTGVADHVGLNESVPATCFPTASALASSWDTTLMNKVGKALAEECIKENVAVLLGPGVNIKRSPLCGRNFEYFSEDPYQGGAMAAALAGGIQSKNIGTSLKHFAVNNQEKCRMTVDAIVDERALREIYLAGFETVIKDVQPHTLMSAYNKINGEYCSENSWLLNTVLRDEWAFEGLVVTDWGANNDRVKGLIAGLDLEMPSSGGGNDTKIVSAVMDGNLDESVLDRTVHRLLTLVLRNSQAMNDCDESAPDMEAHHQLAREAEVRSAVLLKNEDFLPLTDGTSIAVIGTFAETPRYQGSGSSLINPTRLDSALAAIQSRFGPESVTYARGYDPELSEPDDQLVMEAVRIASVADVALIFAGLPEVAESEGFDREHLDMPESHNTLISAVAKANPATAVILSNGAPVTMPWLSEVKAVLESYLGGQAWGSAVADLISGDISPSGKLAETFPLSLKEDPAQPNFPGGGKSVYYAESLWVGYRYYEASKTPVLFPFGHGLSYTSFEYSGLTLDEPVADGSVAVSFTIRNTGNVPGDEISQVYVRDVETTVFRPEKELKGFSRTALLPGEEKVIKVMLNRRAFEFWDKGRNTWSLEAGEFDILVGASSADIRQEGRITITTGDTLSEWARSLKMVAPDYYSPSSSLFSSAPSDGRFSALLGRDLPPLEQDVMAPFYKNSTLGEIRRNWAGNLLYKALIMGARRQIGDDPKTLRMMEAMFTDIPLRNLMTMSGGKITETMLSGFLTIFNKHFFRGLKIVLRENRRIRTSKKS